MGQARDRIVATIGELDREKRRMESMLEQLGDAVLLADADGRVLEANHQAERILPFLASPGPGPLATRIPELARLFFAPGDATAEIARTGAGARRRWFEARVRDVPGPDGKRCHLVVIRDVSDAREIEQLKRDFLSVVTHELRTPLTAIDGYAKLLAMNKGGELSPKQRGFVETILDQSGVLKGMVQNLLDTTRLDGGTLPIDPQDTDADALFATLTATWRGPVEGRRLRFRASAEGLAGLRVRVDSARIDQVVGNLVSNAVKFTPEGGEVALLGARDGRDLVVTVADTGRGIPPEAQAHVFDKFYQVERGDTRVAGGSGLGLYIARQLVEAQGGRIALTSTVGEGSRFDVRLPLLEPA
jgi:signal transduction histidine kinase